MQPPPALQPPITCSALAWPCATAYSASSALTCRSSSLPSAIVRSWSVEALPTVSRSWAASRSSCRGKAAGYRRS
mgnify:CR=1 FL=1